MDVIDRKLMNLLQEGLPLTKDPYGVVAGEIGISRAEVAGRIAGMMESGYIRRLGGVFDSNAMGYSSLLVGARVPEEIFQDVGRFVNALPGVTHNYRRTGFLNMWFTLSTTNEDEKDAVMDELRRRFGLTFLFAFPKVRSFKLKVFFDMEKE